MPNPIPLARYLGCLVGLAVGDATGAPFEGLDTRTIVGTFGDPRDIVAKPPKEMGTIYYTDDTQMTISVAETLLAHDGIDGDALAQAFVKNYDPRRGYGQGARELIGDLADGGDWRILAPAMFGGKGSYGNGGAMRVAPVAMRFPNDPQRASDEAEKSACVTHSHELGIDGTRIMAEAVRYCLTADKIDPLALLKRLVGVARTEEFRWQLLTAQRLTPGEAAGMFGNSLEAHRSVTTAILCFAASPDDYSQVLARCIAKGNDTDTLAAMACSLSGAWLGIDAVPAHLVQRFETQPKDLKYIRGLAEQLWSAASR